MKQDNDLAKKMVAFMYGLLDYKLPENATMKAVLFYSTEDDKETFEKNGVFCLSKDCTREEVIDALNNKATTYKYIGFHIDDLKMSICLEDFNIPSIYLTSSLDETLFDTLNIAPNPSIPINFSEDDIKSIQSLIKKYVEKYKAIKISNAIFVGIISDNKEIDEIFIRSILETKYNIMNIFQEFSEEMTNIVNNYARSFN